MSEARLLGEVLRERGVSRRAFLKYAGYMASLMALPPSAAGAMAEGLAKARRQAVIWLSFQECTGCIESLTRSFSPSLEDLIFDFISLDYQHALQAASGEAAEEARRQSMRENKGKYIVIVDGSVPMGDGGVYSTVAGHTNQAILAETIADAAAVVAVGTCAAFGGLPEADPNPTGAVPISQLVGDKPLINIPGCPPMPQAMAGTLLHILSFGKLPELDHLHRPRAFFGENIHDRCYRRPFYERGMFAGSFDDEGARQGWCLYNVGCKGPQTFSPCPIFQWNMKTSWPIGAGHPCIGCTEPYFWDTMTPFYQRLPDVGGWGIERSIDRIGVTLAGLTLAGIGAHATWTAVDKMRRKRELPVVTEPRSTNPRSGETHNG